MGILKLGLLGARHDLEVLRVGFLNIGIWMLDVWCWSEA